MASKSSNRECIFSLAFSLGSFGLACGSLWSLNPSDRITLPKGAFLNMLGFVYFISLTDFFHKLMLKTQIGLNFVKKYRLRLSDVLDITNKLVSAVQASLSCIAGLIVCRWSCTMNFLHASHFMSESYAWFAASYFFYDLWSMYKVYSATTTLKIKEKLGLKNNNKKSNNEKTSFNESKETKKENSKFSYKRKETDDIPNFKDGNLSLWKQSRLGIPSFAKYLLTHPLIVFHHLFIGSYGLVVISYLRGGLGDCIFSFFYLMELSTPFVSFRSILSTMGLKISRTYVINGLLMLVTFFFCRVFMIPYVIYWYSLVVDLNYWQAILSLPRGCKISILLMLLPQLYWFRLMLIGAMKVFFTDSRSSEAAKMNGSSSKSSAKALESKDDEVRSLM